MKDEFEYKKYEKIYGPIRAWKTSRVTDMSYLFKGKSLWDTIYLLGVSNVKNMKGMFSDIEGQSCHPNISGWDVSKVTNMSHILQVLSLIILSAMECI